MSSDTFIIRIIQRDGARVCLRAALSGAQDFEGMPYPDGRSFFLMLAYMEDPAPENAPPEECGALRQALWEQALGDAREPFDLLIDPAWLEANIDRFVPRVSLTRTRMLCADQPREEQARFGRWIWEQAHGERRTDADPAALYLDSAPSFDCMVEFAQPEYAEHLPTGKVFGTAAYAAFREPPWSTPKLANAPDWIAEEFIAGPDGSPLPAPPRPVRPARGRGRATKKG